MGFFYIFAPRTHAIEQIATKFIMNLLAAESTSYFHTHNKKAVAT